MADPSMAVYGSAVSCPVLWSTTKVKYGYFETRMQVANANVDTDFWLSNCGPQPNGDPWTEIDMSEQYGSYTAYSRRTSNYFLSKGGTQLATSTWTAPAYYNYQGNSGDLPTSYHVNGCYWSPTEFDFYADGLRATR